MSNERITNSNQTGGQIHCELANMLTSIRTGIYKAEQVVKGGANGAILSQRSLVTNIPEYASLMDGQTLEARTHFNPDVVLSRVSKIPELEALSLGIKVYDFVRCAHALPEGFSAAKRLQSFLPIVLPLGKIPYDVLHYMANTCRDQFGIPNNDSLTERLKALRVILGCIDAAVTSGVEEDSDLLAKLNSGIQEEVSDEIKHLLATGDSQEVIKAKQILVAEKVAKMRRTPAPEGSGHHSVYVVELNRIIQEADLENKARTKGHITAKTDPSQLEEELAEVAQNRFMARGRKELVLANIFANRVRQVSDREDVLVIPQREIERHIGHVSIRRTSGVSKIREIQSDLAKTVEEIRLLYALVPQDATDSEYKIRISEYRAACEAGLSQGEYQRLKPFIETLSKRQLVYKMAKVLLEKRLAGSLNTQELSDTLRQLVIKRVIKERKLLERPIREAVDEAIASLGIDPKAVVDNPNILAANTTSIVEQAIAIAKTKLAAEAESSKVNKELQADQQRLVRTGEVSGSSWKTLRPLLHSIYLHEGQYPERLHQLGFTKAILEQVAKGEKTGSVIHNPKDFTALAAKLKEPTDVLRFGAISCPDWGWHLEDGITVFEMGTLKDGFPRTATTLLEYSTRIAALAKEHQRQVSLSVAFPEWELTRAPILTGINNGIRSEEALVSLTRTADTTIEAFAQIHNEFFSTAVQILRPPEFHTEAAALAKKLLRGDLRTVGTVLRARSNFYYGNTNLAALDLAEARIGFNLIAQMCDVVLVPTSPTMARACLSGSDVAWIQLRHGYQG